MDPNATLDRWERAEDDADALEYWQYLSDWIASGGFEPKWSATERRRFAEWGQRNGQIVDWV